MATASAAAAADAAVPDPDMQASVAAAPSATTGADPGAATEEQSRDRETVAPSAEDALDTEAPTLPEHETVVLHVLDEQRRVNRDFVCRKDVLLREMKYFRQFLGKDGNSDDVDISVHCDVKIFEWLVAYLHNTSFPPQLEPSSVVSILISSDFLQMERLVRESLAYLRNHLNEVIRLPIDLNCIRDELVYALADLFTDTELDAVRDPKTKITHRMWQRKVDLLLADRENQLQRCAFCALLFTPARRAFSFCPRAKVFIDFHGNVLAEHVTDRTFDATQYVKSLARRMPPRDVYWRLWGYRTMLECTVCQTKFPVTEMEHCSYHPRDPVFQEGSNTGQYAGGTAAAS